MRPTLIGIATLALGMPLDGPVAFDSASRCRCAQLTLERYFSPAEIVVAGRVESVRRAGAGAEGPERLYVAVRSLFGSGSVFKGSLESTLLATPASPAACGIPVEAGQDYLIFAARQMGDNTRLAWFDSCSGSRAYPGSSAARAELFLGLSPARAMARLVELAADQSDHGLPAEQFHTSPACWSEPRIYHSGISPAAAATAVEVTRVSWPTPDAEGLASPHRVYTAWALATASPGEGATVLVSVERPTLLRIRVAGAGPSPARVGLGETAVHPRHPEPSAVCRRAGGCRGGPGDLP